MKLDEYIKQHTNRKAFAKVIGVKISYLNNLCQRPVQAGKKTIAKIEQATEGQVTFRDMIY